MSKRFRFAYEADGLDEHGDVIPDVPVVYFCSKHLVDVPGGCRG